jgi:hypothetical protein
MSHHYSLLAIFLIIFFLQITYLHANPTNSEGNNHILDENLDTVHYLMKNILTETNLQEQMILLNQLREYLNGMCVIGSFGSTHAHACQRIVDIVHQINSNDEGTYLHDDNEPHGIQKRFFCNGFIGCKNAGR